MERTADGRIHTSQWDDLQYKHGNRVGKYATHELELLAQKIADENPNVTLTAYDPKAERVADKLQRGGYEMDEEKEDDDGAIMNSDDEDDALAAIRRRRLAELQKQRASERFGVLKHLPGSDYVEEVTNASEQSWVVGVLVKPGHSDCEALLNVMGVVAQRQRSTKFVSMVAVEVIPNFPDHHLPCVLLYHKKQLQKQLTGLDGWKADRLLTVESVETVLRQQNVLPREDGEEDARPDPKPELVIDSDESDGDY